MPDPLADSWDDMVRRNRLIQALNDPTATGQGVADSDPPSNQTSPEDDLSIDDWMALRDQQLADPQSGSNAAADATGNTGVPRGASEDSAGEESSFAYGAGDDQLVGSPGHDTLSGADRVISDLEAPLGFLTAKDANGKLLHPIGHPGFAESLVPVEGAGREGLADFQEGHPIMGTLNLGLAGLELTGIGDIGSDLVKGGLRLGKSQTWTALRKAYGKEGLIDAYQPGHHIIPRQYIPDWIPDRLANHWLNVLPMKDQVIEGVEHAGAQVHRRLHGRAKVDGEWLPEFSPFQKLQYGTKASTTALAGYFPQALARTGIDGVFDGPND